MSAHPEPRHLPVLAEETLRLLDPQPGETWVDCTTGGGGHARLIAEKVGPTGRLIGLDQDPTMLALARTTLNGLPATLIHANFDQLAEVLRNQGVGKVDGVLADIGFSSDQMNDPTRGLSFKADGPLDMRLDPTAGATAADLVNTMSEQALADVFYEYGEERKSRWVAKRIVERRKAKPFETTAELADVVRSCVPRSGNIDPATRVFQALRIAVNDELGVLERLLAVLPAVLKPGGRAGIISFHSLEDRRVKQAFRKPDVWQVKTKKPVEAGDTEVARNPRARSAKLRVAVRV
jgi:16S rRNA (cytosine1402-N4)-methyltransferase